MAVARFFQDLVGGSRPRGADGPPPPVAAPAPVDPFDYADTRIPHASRGHIAKVLGLIGDIETAAQAEEMWSPMLIEIRQIADVHLPALIKSYIDIPAAHRAEIFRNTGRSASFMLNDGLDKLTERLRAMSLSLAQGNIDAFNSAMRFIEMRYGANPIPRD